LKIHAIPFTKFGFKLNELTTLAVQNLD